MRKILAVGPLWRGSNAGGLFRAFLREGCSVNIIDENYYVSLSATNLVNKIISKLIRPIQTREFNNSIKLALATYNPDVLFIYKGAFVFPETVRFAKENNIKVYMFYPDVSIITHGKHLPVTIPYYDMIFTTKTFGITDLKERYGYNNAVFVPHGYDPEIHRKLTPTDKDNAIYGCDASFIGTWSPKKEKMLSYLKSKLPNIELKIWGQQWNKNTSSNLESSIKNQGIFGDEYVLAIRCSKINLGILNEKVQGASSGDLITSRTFHIAGAGGFLLHERTEESVLYYEEGNEAAFFDGMEEMSEKVEYYLARHDERSMISENGHKRALAEHSLDARAKTIIKYF